LSVLASLSQELIFSTRISSGEFAMGWAEHRISEYQQGKPANWVEKRALEHANPVHLVLSTLAAGVFVYGLWTHSIAWITMGLLLASAGHGYCWTRKML
jgi:hypothetical protein